MAELISLQQLRLLLWRLHHVAYLENHPLTAKLAAVQLCRETAQNVIVALQGKTPRSVVNARALGLA